MSVFSQASRIRRLVGLVLLAACSLGFVSCIDVVLPTEDNPATLPVSRADASALRLAKRASSSHNMQPWHIAVQPSGAYRLTVAGARRLAVVDPVGREEALCLGAFLGALEWSADLGGLACAWQLDAASTELAVNFQLAANTGVVATSTRSSPDLGAVARPSEVGEAAFLASMTHKEALATDAPDAATMALWQSLATDPRTRLIWVPRTGGDFAGLAPGLADAALAQANNDAAQAELARSFVYRKADAARGWGITPEMLGLDGFTCGIWYSFFDEATVMGQDFRAQAKTKVESGLAACSGLLVISTMADDRDQLLAAGRLYQHLLLVATARSYGLQPLSAIIEEPGWRQKLLPTWGSVQLVLRVGGLKPNGVVYTAGSVDAIASASIRMPLSQLLVAR